MSIESLIQITLFGLVWGGLYALVACGLNLVAGVMKVMNIAHGEMMMLGAYVAFWAFTLWGINPLIGAVLGGVLLFAIGTLLYHFIVSPVLGASANVPQLERGTLIGFFAIIIIFQNVALLLWGADYRVLMVLQDTVPGLQMSASRVVVFVLSVATVFGLHLLLMKTRFGAAVRAVSQDRTMASMLSIDVRRIDLVAFALGTALAGFGGGLASLIYVVTPTMGLLFTLKAFTVMVLGGVGNILGAIGAGLALGVLEEWGALLIGETYKDVIGYALLTIVILLISYGVLRRREIA